MDNSAHTAQIIPIKIGINIKISSDFDEVLGDPVSGASLHSVLAQRLVRYKEMAPTE